MTTQKIPNASCLNSINVCYTDYLFILMSQINFKADLKNLLWRGTKNSKLEPGKGERLRKRDSVLVYISALPCGKMYNVSEDSNLSRFSAPFTILRQYLLRVVMGAEWN